MQPQCQSAESSRQFKLVDNLQLHQLPESLKLSGSFFEAELSESTVPPPLLPV